MANLNLNYTETLDKISVLESRLDSLQGDAYWEAASEITELENHLITVLPSRIEIVEDNNTFNEEIELGADFLLTLRGVK